MAIRSRTVDRTPSLGSLLLGSRDPSRLRDWYLEAFGVAADQFGFVGLGGFGVMPDQREDLAAANPEPGRFVLNLEVPDAQAAVERVERAGTTWIAPLEQREAGAFATFTDPDGNYLQLIQLNEQMRGQMLEETRKAAPDGKPFSGIAVNDIAAAKKFYSTVLGIDVTEQNGMLALWLDASTSVLAYPKSDHVPARHTVLNFPVDDIDQAVGDLTAAGVQMLSYPGMPQDDKGVMREGGPLIAWFTDPAGNILSVLQER
ncbi:MAG: VOC family protein [Nakamurella sp.]